MDLSQLISEAAAKYPVAKQQSFGGNAIADLFKSDIPDLLRTKLNLPESKFKITGSIGTGNFAAVPCIAIMNREFTESTQDGVYVVFLFSTNGRTVYLSLNQGVTYLKGNHFKKDKIKDIASRLRTKFTNPNKYMGPINLEATTDTTRIFLRRLRKNSRNFE